MEFISSNPVGFGTGVFYALAFIIDLWLKFTGRRSISEWIWYLTEKHPTEHEVFMAFNNDEDAAFFIEWWNEVARFEFKKWLDARPTEDQ